MGEELGVVFWGSSTSSPSQGSIKHTVGHNTSSFLAPSRYSLSRWPGLGIFSVRPRLVAVWCYFVLEVSEFSSGAGGVVLFLPGV